MRADCPTVQILMAVYNGEEYLREQIDSLLAQTFGDWELLVSDDASTDGSLAILREFTATRLPGVTLVEPEGTYLPWLDFSGTGLRGKALDDFVTHKAGLWLDDGEIFGPGGEGFARINIACPAATLRQALIRLEKALNALKAL